MDRQIVDMTLNLKTIALLIPPSLLRIRFFWSGHAMGGASRDFPEKGCGGDNIPCVREKEG